MTSSMERVKTQLESLHIAEGDIESTPGTAVIVISNDATDVDEPLDPDRKPIQREPSVVLIGGCVLDVYARTEHEVEHDGSAYEGTLSENAGGVARNIADALARLGTQAKLISVIGADLHGDVIQRLSRHMDFSGVEKISEAHTASYVGFESAATDQVAFGVINLQILNFITADLISQHEKSIANAKMVILDGNVPVSSIQLVANLCLRYGTDLWFEPTDKNACGVILKTGVTAATAVTHISPNWSEFVALTGTNVDLADIITEPWLKGLKPDIEHMLCHFPNLRCLVLSLGHRGLVSVQRQGKTATLEYYASTLPPGTNIVSSSGPGDW